MHFEYRVTVEVTREQGRFASRDDIGGQIVEALEDADPGTISGENDGEYSTIDWTVEEVAK